MSQGLKNATGGGMSKRTLSADQKALLMEGDIEGLLEFHDIHFGGARMEDEDEDDEDDEDEDDESEDEAEDDGDDEDEDDESDDDKTKSKGKEKGKEKLDPKDEKIQALTAEAKKYRLKNRDHRTRIAELEAEVAELKRGKKTTKKTESDEDDGEPAEDPEVKRKLQAAERTNEDLLIRLEFLSNNKFQWRNPKAALKLLDLSDVEIDEDGDVLGLDEAIEQLAEKEPYLLAQDEPKPTKKQRRQPSGQPTGTKRKGNPNRDKLLSKYPALRR